MSEQTLVERLLKMQDHWSSSLRHEAADRIEELEAIVEKLPKTADGVTVVSGMKLYQDDRQCNVTGQYCAWLPGEQKHFYLYAEVWFSTRAAAEAAAAKGART